MRAARLGLVEYVSALLDNITGSPDYESDGFSFPYPTEKCSRDPQPEDCCPNLDKSLIRNVTTSPRVPSKLLIGIGTLKSGTHFVDRLLQQHPKFTRGIHKELQYFYEREKYKDGKEGYLELLGVNVTTPQKELDNQIFYEITPGTLKASANEEKLQKSILYYSVRCLGYALAMGEFDMCLFVLTMQIIVRDCMQIPWAPCYLKPWFPHAKFLVILRNPTMRALSQLRYKQSRCIEGARDGELDSINDCCQYFRSSMKWLGSLLRQLWGSGCTYNEGKEGKSWKACANELWGEDAMDVGSAGMLVQGLYAPQIAWWMEFFPPSQFIFVKAEDLYQDPIGEMNKILEAFDVSPKFGEGGISLDHSEDKHHKTNSSNIFDPLMDEFMDAMERFHYRHNKELSMFLEKQGIPLAQFNQGEVAYENGEIFKRDFFRSQDMQCPERYNWP
ncbi:hypothetical protein BSKO_01216 [Bryopsis sp. KO-2023]|nr:hypothetical protein BSKO_01216 [Bryopsis sp. KO-2023]